MTAPLYQELVEALSALVKLHDHFRTGTSGNQADAYYTFVKGEDETWKAARSALSRAQSVEGEGQGSASADLSRASSSPTPSPAGRSSPYPFCNHPSRCTRGRCEAEVVCND